MGGKNDYLLQSQPALLKSSTCQCVWGGTISLVTDGQTSTGLIDLSMKPLETFTITPSKAKDVLGDKWDDYTEKEKQHILEMAEGQPKKYSEELRIKKADNMLALEKALGVTKGEAMSTEDADKQNANPNYRSDRQYRINCATCAAAYALRKSGFDITAKGNTPGTRNEWLSYAHSFDIWNNADGTKAEPTLVNDWMRANNIESMTGEDYKKFYNETCKEEGIYVVTVKWKEKEVVDANGNKTLVSNGAHATVLQRDSDGKLYYIEPQVYESSKGEDGRRSLDDLIYNANGNLKLSPTPPDSKGAMRVDDKLFNTEYVDLFNT